MRKLLTICMAVAVMAIAAQAQVGDIASLEKTFDEESAGLCEHVIGDIVVETLAAGVVVADEMPDGISLVNVTVAGGAYSSLSFDKDGLEVTLDGVAEYTISIEVQVTDVLSYDSIVVVNTATATDSGGNVDTASDDLELLQYTNYFDKTFEDAWLEGGDPVDQYAVPLGTKVYFLMYVDLYNSLSVSMLNAYVKDNLGGDLMLEEWYTGGTGSAYISKLSGKTEKAHLMWEIGNIGPGGSCISDLLVSTDTNTGTGNGKKDGHQEYTDDEPTVHELNSGATLKFTASDTGLTCSVSSAPVEIQTAIPD